MKNIPDKIYLQVDSRMAGKDDFKASEVTWCTDKINKHDVEYIRAERASTGNQLYLTPEISMDSDTLRIISFVLIGWSCERIRNEVYNNKCSRQTVWRKVTEVQQKYPFLFGLKNKKKDQIKQKPTSGQIKKGEKPTNS